MLFTSIFRLLSITISYWIRFSRGHVSLVFPPARYPPLDFLDNTRTPEPCGVPRSQKTQYTNLVLGQTYDLVWHLGYAHKGGFQLDLLNANGKLAAVLTPNGFVGNEPINETTQSYILTIPHDLQPCNQCILRLQRKAQEWNEYKFWSCADINIVRPSGSVVAPCFGTANGQTCQCPRLQYGQYCQFYDECAADSDCGMTQGKCVDLKTSSYPKKVCYCIAPYFGKHCEKKFDPKPEDLKQKCFNYKFNQPTLNGLLGLDNSQSQFSGKGLYNPKCYHKANLIEDNVFVYWRYVGDEVEMIMDYPGQSWVGVGWRPDYLNGRCQEFPVKTDDVARFKRDPASTTLGGGPRSSSPHPHATAEPEPRPQPERGNGLPRPEPRPEPEAPAALHPMDCTDIVVGSCQGNLSRASDMYTRDRSTPMDDAVYKGKDDLTAVFGFEIAGRTVVMFRRPISASGESDHELKGEMRMIWARGQQPSEKQSVGHSEFYETDVLKYHGGNRGSFLVTFAGDAENDSAKVPPNQSGKNSPNSIVGMNAAQTAGNKKGGKNQQGNNGSTFFLKEYSILCIIFSCFLFVSLLNSL